MDDSKDNDKKYGSKDISQSDAIEIENNTGNGKKLSLDDVYTTPTANKPTTPLNLLGQLRIRVVLKVLAATAAMTATMTMGFCYNLSRSNYRLSHHPRKVMPCKSLPFGHTKRLMGVMTTKVALLSLFPTKLTR